MTTPAMPSSALVISLDFELYWGVRDKAPLESFRERLEGGREVVVRLLKLFAERDVHATWAAVGLLFFSTREELLAALPTRRPNYINTELSPYEQLDQLGASEAEDLYHFAPSLLAQIAAAPHQELASHTFSHYYCLERGQEIEDFREDLRAAQRAHQGLGQELHSLVFPRNQFGSEHLAVCRELGFGAYRGNPDSWLWRAKNEEDESLLRRILRYLDAHLNLAGRHARPVAELNDSEQPLNIPASRFLRPCGGPKILEALRRRRITSEMSHAVANGLLYHVWWHPHNFGQALERNMEFLERILDHFAQLRERAGMQSLNMREVTECAAGRTS